MDEQSKRLQRLNKRRGGAEEAEMDRELEERGLLEDGMTKDQKQALMTMLNESIMACGNKILTHSDDDSQSEGQSFLADQSAFSLNTGSRVYTDLDVVPESPLSEFCYDDDNTTNDEPRVTFDPSAAEAVSTYPDVIAMLDRINNGKLSKIDVKALQEYKDVKIDPWIFPEQRIKDPPPLIMKRRPLTKTASGRPKSRSQQPPPDLSDILRDLEDVHQRLSRGYQLQRSRSRAALPDWGQSVKVGRHMPDTVDMHYTLPFRVHRIKDAEVESVELSPSPPPPLKERGAFSELFTVVEKPAEPTDDVMDLDAGPSAGVTSPQEESKTEAPSGGKLSVHFLSSGDELPAVTTPKTVRTIPLIVNSRMTSRLPVSSNRLSVTATSKVANKTAGNGKVLQETGPSKPSVASKNKEQPLNLDNDLPELDDMFERDQVSVKPKNGGDPTTSRLVLPPKKDSRRAAATDDDDGGEEPVVKTNPGRRTYGHSRVGSHGGSKGQDKPSATDGVSQNSKKRRCVMTATGTAAAKRRGDTSRPQSSVPYVIQDSSSEEEPVAPRAFRSGRSSAASNASMPDVQVVTAEAVSCPLCDKLFPANAIEDHAAECLGVDDDAGGLHELEEQTMVLMNSSRTPRKMNRCYVCRNVYGEGVYVAHVHACIARSKKESENNNIVTTTPKRIEDGKRKPPPFGKSLLGRLTEKEVEGSTGNTVLNAVRERCLKRKRGPDQVLREPRADHLQDCNISLNHVAASPFANFVPISKQTDALIDYKNQFSYSNKPTRVRLNGGKKGKRKRTKRSKRKSK